jgi:hypothetical protein
MTEVKDRLDWYLQAKFGLFIHWGAYSVAGVEASWPIMTPEMSELMFRNTHRISEADYTALPARFNPQKFDPRAWVRLAQEAGMRYIVITSKHHDGFCMFDAPGTDYKITNTPYGKDICLELAEACAEVKAKLVHYSTDYVFDGSRKEYAESDAANPINAYGRSKLRGEQNIVRVTEDYRIVRTSWLFGESGKNFVDTMLSLSKQMENVKVVNDQVGKPTYTVDLAAKTREILEMPPGIYHITNDGTCSWYEFAGAIIPNAVPCTSEEFPRKAKRPGFSVLTNTKTAPLRHWREALADYLRKKVIT